VNLSNALMTIEYILVIVYMLIIACLGIMKQQLVRNINLKRTTS
jgi:hypothetical protein